MAAARLRFYGAEWRNRTKIHLVRRAFFREIAGEGSPFSGLFSSIMDKGREVCPVRTCVRIMLDGRRCVCEYIRI